MLCLIDGDIIRYAVGFAGQKTHYHVGKATFIGKTDLNKFLSYNDVDEASIVEELVVDPVENVLHSVKLMIESILEVTGGVPRIYLSGDSNFRYNFYSAYKANRKDMKKPYHFDAITKYLVDVWDAEIVEGIEADDKLGIEQYKNFSYGKENFIDKEDLGTIICSIDKDLNMIPGWHYNFRTGEKYWINELQGMRNFYSQLLTGDSTDNIPGIPGVGPKTAEKLLAKCSTEQEFMTVVLDSYADWIAEREFGCPVAESWDNIEWMAADEIERNGHLLWILREPDGWWEMKYGEEITKEVCHSPQNASV
jgi:hypothetical protein